jgi:hypothetical protein
MHAGSARLQLTRSGLSFTSREDAYAFLIFNLPFSFDGSMSIFSKRVSLFSPDQRYELLMAAVRETPACMCFLPHVNKDWLIGFSVAERRALFLRAVEKNGRELGHIRQSWIEAFSLDEFFEVVRQAVMQDSSALRDIDLVLFPRFSLLQRHALLMCAFAKKEGGLPHAALHDAHPSWLLEFPLTTRRQLLTAAVEQAYDAVASPVFSRCVSEFSSDAIAELFKAAVKKDRRALGKIPSALLDRLTEEQQAEIRLLVSTYSRLNLN